jgi:DNA modification methylase
MGRLDYDYKHEPILLTWNKTHKFTGGGSQKTSVWEFDKPRASKEHPTMKPVELIENAILNNSEEKDIILDIFGGSGTTIIASEKNNRACRMMELDEHYCDVIVQRYIKWCNENSRTPNVKHNGELYSCNN